MGSDDSREFQERAVLLRLLIVDNKLNSGRIHGLILTTDYTDWKTPIF
jgi:hypothetical protein